MQTYSFRCSRSLRSLDVFDHFPSSRLYVDLIMSGIDDLPFGEVVQMGGSLLRSALACLCEVH